MTKEKNLSKNSTTNMAWKLVSSSSLILNDPWQTEISEILQADLEIFW